MKLSNIKNLGRFKNIITGREYNIKKGRKKGYSVDVLFYLLNGKRIYISDADFYNEYKEIF